ncbi:diacylglycerol kinase family enzyme [Streptacidiphilus sp. MAP12-16]|uniref:diacylglycerol/lipid kinase family protein n=1 Tax=Streptacidiphilus sp. MAP12-16 TaxID=3156300 RepID=UPI003514C701
MEASDSRESSRAGLLARVALLCALAAVVVLLAVTGMGGLLILPIGLAGLAAAAAGVWLLLAHRGVVRWAGAVLAVGAPVAVLVFYTRTGLWSAALGALVLWSAALACARSALRRVREPHGMHAVAGPLPRHPVLIMNPKSGGGKVGRFGLVEKAEQLGARVVLLDTSTYTDVAAVARRAAAEGADLLGVAGGDGTQALVAAVAAEHDLPFLVVSAGTRNHFAMDLGLDRTDPSRCLDALTDGEELRVDLGMVAEHAFVNTVSFGAYAQIVQSSEYRDAKAGTALDALPDLLLADRAGRLEAQADSIRLESQQALLVSNNPYAAAVDPITAGRRPRLDLGTLGVLGVRVDGPAQAAELALRGTQASGMNVLTARTVVVHSDAATIPVAVDGEALQLSTPVICSVRAGALRVRVPRGRPGAPVTSPPLDWRRVIALALGRHRPTPSAAEPSGGSTEGPDDA